MRARGPLVALLVLATSLSASDARAHPIGFAVLAIDAREPSTYDVVLRVSGSETDRGELQITWPAGCVEGSLRETTVDEVRERRLELVCEATLRGRTLSVEGPPRGIELLVEAHFPDGTELRVMRPSLPARVDLGSARVEPSLARAHFTLGLEHFALGFDHVLFVLGAFFLARRLGTRALVAVVTAFTLGHALTLALATFGLLVLAPAPVEAAIALSLVHVARELTLTRPTLTRTRPALACAAFGLVHGAGFARALGDAGLTGGDLVVGLVSFNVGLEVAQLALVLACFAVFRGTWGTHGERAATWLIGSVGAYLFLDRALTLVRPG